MKILVRPRYFIENMVARNDEALTTCNFISIYSAGDISPLPDTINVLRLMFDDVTDANRKLEDIYFFFDEKLAKQIKVFIEHIDKTKPLYIHCDAGVSRSGAVGVIINDYVNKYLENNKNDYKYFLDNNRQVQPNSLVMRILKDVLYGKPDYSLIFAKSNTDESGEKYNDLFVY